MMSTSHFRFAGVLAKEQVKRTASLVRSATALRGFLRSRQRHGLVQQDQG